MNLSDLILLAIGIIIIFSLSKLFRLNVQISEQLDYIREILISSRDYAEKIRDLLKKPLEGEQSK